MSATPWVIIAIGALVLVLAAIFIFLKKGKKQTPDYRTFFYIGIVWIILGLADLDSMFWLLGLVFMTLGLANKDKWKKEKKWKDLAPAEKKFKMILIVLLGILFVVGIVFLILSKKGIL